MAEISSCITAFPLGQSRSVGRDEELEVSMLSCPICRIYLLLKESLRISTFALRRCRMRLDGSLKELRGDGGEGGGERCSTNAPAAMWTCGSRYCSGEVDAEISGSRVMRCVVMAWKRSLRLRGLHAASFLAVSIVSSS